MATVKDRRIYIGMDPGGKGSAFALDAQSRILGECRFERSTIVDICEWYRGADGKGQCFTALESVHSMPKQGVASSFKFGQQLGRLEGLLHALQARHIMVTPQVWQGALGCRTGGDKKIAKAAAERLWPGYKFTQETADGCLIAEYVRRWDMGIIAKGGSGGGKGK